MSPAGSGNSDVSPDKEIVPLGFKTTVNDDGKLVIKAKPLEYSPDEEEQKHVGLEVTIAPGKSPNVIYNDVDLPCDKELRINNTIDAPLRMIHEEREDIVRND